MSNPSSSPPHSVHQGAMRPDNRPVASDGTDGNRRRLFWLSVAPGAVIILVAGATIAYLLANSGTLSSGSLAVILALAGLICLGVLITAAASLLGANRTRQEHLAALRTAAVADAAALPELIRQRQYGESAGPYGQAVNTAGNLEGFAAAPSEFAALAWDLAALRRAAIEATAPFPQQQHQQRHQPQAQQQQPQPVAEPAPVSKPPQAENVLEPRSLIAEPIVAADQRVGVFVNLARRLQSLVHREIKLLDELEAQVEDPDLLKGLFAVDHLATRIRRHAENLAVLGGAVSRRQWSRPVNIYEVLRSAVAEVEHYSRVKLVRPIEGTLQGHAVADVIHLAAELVENATKFSSPHTQVLLRAQRVTAGLAVEVEDRGLGMPREEQNRINAMLAAPDQVNIDELLQDGRIGLFVVSSLARRHGIALQLQTNIYGGTQAVLVLPHPILGDTHQSAVKAVPNRPAVTAAGQPDQEPAPQPTDVSTPPTNEIVEAARSQPSRESATPPRPVADDDTISMPVTSESVAPQHDSGSTAPTSPTWQGMPAPPITMTPNPSAVSPPIPTAEIPPGSFNGFALSQDHSGHAPSVETGTTGNRASRGPGDRPQPGEPSTGLSAAMPRREPGVTRPHSVIDDQRPELPRRRQQTHIAPQLRDAPKPTSDEETEGHDPGLMSAFQRGAARSDDSSAS